MESARKVGEIVGGKYRLVRYLAAGGMGAVWEVQHTLVKRRFAMKLLHPELAAQRDSLTRFQREAQAAGALESENVAAAVDFGIAEDGSPYILMEFLDGESLRALIDRAGPLPVGRAADLATQACRGVGAAHRAGIVHRDLNPQNLFVCRRDDGTDLVKVLDFGIAKLESVESAETRTGTLMGTPAYLSPEQARGERTVDHRADIYGLGAVLYEMLSGKRPHPGDSHNAILHHICTQPALPLDAKDLPPALVETVNHALSSDPQARQESAAALAQELQPWATRQTWPAPPVSKSSASTDGTAPTIRPRFPQRIRSRRWMWGLLLVPALAGLVLAIRSPKPVRARLLQPLPPQTRFFVTPANPGAIQQIAALAKANATREAAAITAMLAVPQSVWFSGGPPEMAQGDVSRIVVRASNDRTVPVLVANNRPYRDCAGLSAGGAKDTAAYRAWIDAFASGIGNERAVVILEPGTTGIIPHNTSLDGSKDWCRPTVTDERGTTVPAPGANPTEAYTQLNYATVALAKRAPNALVYMDGAHADWLAVGEAAFRLYRAGVLNTQGFAVNVASFQSTTHSVQYGTWISKCLYFATHLAKSAGTPDAFRLCASQPMHEDAVDEGKWAATERWYAANVDRVASPSPVRLLHFVVDTGRNGQGAPQSARYAGPPYNQPESVIAGLGAGVWCNPPGMGLGLRPTAATGHPLVDAFLWIKLVGESDGTCDIAGGTRAWDYGQYNPWDMTGDAQKHFDPLWGMVNPAAGAWFPEQALDLALHANPPLQP
jgi:endoglucanase